ncbi:MAG TPA: hypothetical protein GX405_02055 [Rhizobiales bacterium]|nr:hypothetical protein [Hyphomicrobiales bacterium]
MDGGRRNERMLLKIAALLVSLAFVAERAAGRSLPLRFLVVAILSRAEAIARAFVAREAPIGWPSLPEAPEFFGHPADAASLALRLHRLARILVDVVETGCFVAGDEPYAGVAPLDPSTILLFVVPGRPRRHGAANRPWNTS